MRRGIFLAAALLLSAVLSGCTALPENGPKVTVRVMAAASLTESLHEIAKEYEKQNPGVRLELNFAGTQALVSQLEQGVEADVFISANRKYMEEMQDKGYADAYTMFVTNALVAAAYREADISNLADLVKPGIKLAVADESVPAGQYTVEMLDKIEAAGKFPSGYKADFLDNVCSLEMDVKSVVAKIQLGEVDAGIVYKTDVATDNTTIKTIEIPAEYNCVAQYPVAVLTGSSEKDAAGAFAAYLLSDAGMQVMEKYGFDAASG